MAQSYANSCPQGHASDAQRRYNGAYVGENLAWHSSANPSGGPAKFAVDMWSNEANDYVYSSNSCRSVCGHYTQIVWDDSINIGCGVSSCSQWKTTVVCRYMAGGNYMGEKPYATNGPPAPPPTPPPATCPPLTPSGLCSGRCNSVTNPSNACTYNCGQCPAGFTCNGNTCVAVCSRNPASVTDYCAANSLTCGLTTDNCGVSINCGLCVGQNQACVNNRCQCQPNPNPCSSRVCGSIGNGCGSDVPCGTCPAGQSCNNGQCISNCQPAQKPGDYVCGQWSDGCNVNDLGSCPAGQICSDFKCVAAPCNPGCSINGRCNNGVCSCNLGFQGDGITCTIDLPPIVNQPTDWAVVNENSKYTFLSDSVSWNAEPSAVDNQLSWSGSKDLFSTYGSGDVSWVCQVIPSTTNSKYGLGIRLGQGTGATDQLYFEVSGGQMRYKMNLQGTNSQLVSAAVPANIGSAGQASWFRLRQFFYQGYLTLMGTIITGQQTFSAGWYWQAGLSYFPETGTTFLHSSGDSTTFSTCYLATTKTVKVTLSSCKVTDDELKTLIASTLGIPAANIEISRGCFQNKRDSEQTGVEVEFSITGTETATSEGLSSSFVSSVEAGSPVLASNGIGASGASVAATAAIPAIVLAEVSIAAAVAAAAPLSVGAIAGIAVASAVVVAGAAFGIAVAVKHKKEKKVYTPEPAPASADPSKPAPPPRSNVRRTIYKMFHKNDGVNINMETMDPNDHKSITARQAYAV
eukprot:TRINITY_DN65058_c0_g1_i3.p1 TRINITY_DN65058_c0_g1~~TRINITY_DN65058_c0_g1_i3.p1  ORF type:complete len:809 (+),score=241.63 TRINITY_DN65058_c0_g1_i3:197-2428(+)